MEEARSVQRQIVAGCAGAMAASACASSGSTGAIADRGAKPGASLAPFAETGLAAPESATFAPGAPCRGQAMAAATLPRCRSQSRIACLAAYFLKK